MVFNIIAIFLYTVVDNHNRFVAALLRHDYIHIESLSSLNAIVGAIEKLHDYRLKQRLHQRFYLLV